MILEPIFLSKVDVCLSVVPLSLDTPLVSLQAVGVSAVTGQGVDEFFAAVGEAAEEFERYMHDYSKGVYQ